MLIELWARREIYGNEKANVNRKIISACGKPVFADDALERFRKPPDQRRDGEDLIAGRERRVLNKVDHLDLVPPSQMAVTDAFEVGHGGHRLGCLAGNVQPQMVGIPVR